MSDTHRTVGVERTAPGTSVARNVRGGELSFGSADEADVTPVGLLVAATAGCACVDIEVVTGRRVVLPRALQVSHDRSCTVSRTIEPAGAVAIGLAQLD